jgi:hypothetical protein
LINFSINLWYGMLQAYIRYMGMHWPLHRLVTCSFGYGFSRPIFSISDETCIFHQWLYCCGYGHLLIYSSGTHSVASLLHTGTNYHLPWQPAMYYSHAMGVQENTKKTWIAAHLCSVR